ncbi:MAG: DUF6814 family protein [Chitinophagaceae bacterium]
MNALKRTLGLLWLLAGPVAIFFLLAGALRFVDLNGKADINNPVIWLIIIVIFLPIALGLLAFGWYAWKGEYDHLPEDSTEL